MTRTPCGSWRRSQVRPCERLSHGSVVVVDLGLMTEVGADADNSPLPLAGRGNLYITASNGTSDLGQNRLVAPVSEPLVSTCLPRLPPTTRSQPSCASYWMTTELRGLPSRPRFACLAIRSPAGRRGSTNLARSTRKAIASVFDMTVDELLSIEDTAGGVQALVVPPEAEQKLSSRRLRAWTPTGREGTRRPRVADLMDVLRRAQAFVASRGPPALTCPEPCPECSRTHWT